MDNLDPSLRAAEHQQTDVSAGDVSESVFAFTNVTQSEAETEQHLAQQLAAQGLPYYNEQLEQQLGQPEQQTTQQRPPVQAKPILTTVQPVQYTPNEPKRRPKSCESCRGLKVKCEPNEAGQGEGPCKRCVKAGRECVYSETSGRRKKKQDNKVAELEKKVNGLTAALLAQQGTEATDGLDGLSKKRSRSEFELDAETVDGRPTKHQAVIPSIDPGVLNELVTANGTAVKEFVSGLKTVDAWYKQAHPIKAVNGKKAPTAQMGRGTPLDLLSQVASNEKPPQNQVYSPYTGYYDKKDGVKNELEELLQKEFGSRGGLVLGFLNVFLTTISESATVKEEDENP